MGSSCFMMGGYSLDGPQLPAREKRLTESRSKVGGVGLPLRLTVLEVYRSCRDGTMHPITFSPEKIDEIRSDTV